MALLDDLNSISMNTTPSEDAVIVNEAMKGEGTEGISMVFDATTESSFYVPERSMLNTALLKATRFAPNSAQRAVARDRWTEETAAVAKMKKSILMGQHPTNPLAINYLAWMKLNKANKASAMFLALYRHLKLVDSTFNVRGAMLVAVAAVYSYVAEGLTDPLAAENWVVTPTTFKRLPNKDSKGRIVKPGTGIGLQQWSFERHDDLLLNLSKWSKNTEANSLGSILPSVIVQSVFAAKELLSTDTGKKIAEIANQPTSTVEEVMIRFFAEQNGPGYKGVCLLRIIDRRLELNKEDLFDDSLTPNRDKMIRLARNHNINGKACPNAAHG